MEKLAGRVMLSFGYRRAGLAFLAGAIGALALPPFGFFAVLFVSFSVLVWLLDGATGNPDRGFFGGCGLFPSAGCLGSVILSPASGGWPMRSL